MELMAGRTRRGDCGETGSTGPGSGVVSCASQCPLRGALYSHAKRSPASCGTRLWGSLEAEGGEGGAGRTQKLVRACTQSRQPPQTTPAVRALLLTLECRLSLLTLAGSAEFYLSPLAPHECFSSGPLPCPQFRVSGLIPAQECNYLLSCPRPGEYKQLAWRFGFSIWWCLSGRLAPSSIPCRAGLGAGAQAPCFSEVPVPFLAQKSEKMGSVA